MIGMTNNSNERTMNTTVNETSAPSKSVVKQYDSVMIDLETMGFGPNAAVIQIGAVVFNWTEGYHGPVFKADVDLHSSVLAGGRVTHDVADWWRQRGGLKMTAPVYIAQALLLLRNYLGRYPELKRVWANGLSFDIAILEGFYQRLDLEVPWSYNIPRDTRTIQDFAIDLGWKKPKKDVAHEAVADCLAQIDTLMGALSFLRQGREDVQTILESRFPPATPSAT